MVSAAVRSESTKTALAAPRERASRPSAPVPAKRSSTSAPSTGPMRLKTASRTRSPVGRTSSPLGAKIRAPLREPAIILNPFGFPAERIEDLLLLVEEPLSQLTSLDNQFSISAQTDELQVGEARLA